MVYENVINDVFTNNYNANSKNITFGHNCGQKDLWLLVLFIRQIFISSTLRHQYINYHISRNFTCKCDVFSNIVSK